MPRRRCVGCGRVAPKSELLRFAVVHDAGAPRSRARAVLDAAGRLPGRGAYLCRGSELAAPDPACLESALRRGGLVRTLRRAVTLDLSHSSGASANS